MSLSEDLAFVVSLAESAATIVLDHYGKVERLTKRQAEAVTEADRMSQRHIVAALRKKFPGDGIIGEENETGDAITFDVPNPSGRVWVIDPIDGTNNFVAGLGAFAVCIGLLDAGMPVLGVVRDVMRGITYRACKGGGAWLENRPLRVIQGPMNASSLIMLTSSLSDAQGNAPPWALRWLNQTEWKIRILGSATLEAANVASGAASGAVTINGKLWDVVAPAALVLEAGGVVTDFTGRPVFPFPLTGYTGGKVPFLAGGPLTHSELLKEMQSR
jgi:myo-inositol-1(or 4)-monophosphatase